MAEKADDVIGQLGGFALDEVLSSLQLPAAGVKDQLGVSNAAFSRESIYAGKFVDDDDGDDEREDYEAIVDKEMYSEKWSAKPTGAAAGGGAKLLRGEEDDFDDDDEEEEGSGAAAVKVKQEAMDEDDLFGDGGEERYQETSVEPIAPPPPIQQVRVQDVFPDFEYGKVLDFTDLFATRPRKRRRQRYEGVKCASSSSAVVEEEDTDRDSYCSRPSSSGRASASALDPRRPGRPASPNNARLEAQGPSHSVEGARAGSLGGRGL